MARSFEDIVACLAVRLAVFVSEQGVPLDEEVDAYDGEALHYCAELNERVVGTARLVMLDSSTGKIGRVAVLAAHRGEGIGSALMGTILRGEAARLPRIVLDSQTTALEFYERFGFRAEGEVFLDAGIPHRRMTRWNAHAAEGAPSGAPR